MRMLLAGHEGYCKGLVPCDMLRQVMTGNIYDEGR